MTRALRNALGDLVDLGIVLIFVCAVAMAYVFAVVLYGKVMGNV